MLVNTLADNKYDEYSYWVVIVSTILSLTILTLDFIKNRKMQDKSNSVVIFKAYSDYGAFFLLAFFSIWSRKPTVRKQ